MRLIIAFLLALITIALCATLVIEVIPVVRLALQVKKVTRKLERFSRRWKKVERKFITDKQFREMFEKDPSKLSGFFRIVDSLNKTDFCKGLTSDQLTGLFAANPDVMQSRVEEYLCYRETAKI